MRHCCYIGFAIVLLAACGDDSGGSGKDGGSKDGGTGNDASLMMSCQANGASCTTGVGCCSGACDTTTHSCTATGGSCTPQGAACTQGTDCCGLSCSGNACGFVCRPTGTTCSKAADCCTGICNGTCQAIPGGSCTTLGNSCSGDAACCSGNCQGGLCARAFSCASTGDVCYRGTDCCSNLCKIASGSTVGTCGTVSTTGAGACGVDGQACTSGDECCSQTCVPTVFGGHACQIAAGCRVVGDLCRTDTDCCGAGKLPDGTTSTLPGAGEVTCVLDPTASPAIGRCRNPTGNNPEGDTCGAFGASQRMDCADCQSPKAQCCKLDAAGVPRCYGGSTGACPTGFTGAAGCCIAAGQTCTFSSECCNGDACVPDSTGVLKCAGTRCVAPPGVCTSTSDCCSGATCQIPAGAPAGTCVVPPPPSNDGGLGDAGLTMCSLVGQACGTTTPCCSGGAAACRNITSGAQCAAGDPVCSCYPPIN